MARPQVCTSKVPFRKIASVEAASFEAASFEAASFEAMLSKDASQADSIGFLGQAWPKNGRVFMTSWLDLRADPVAMCGPQCAVVLSLFLPAAESES